MGYRGLDHLLTGPASGGTRLGESSHQYLSWVIVYGGQKPLLRCRVEAAVVGNLIFLLVSASFACLLERLILIGSNEAFSGLLAISACSIRYCDSTTCSLACDSVSDVAIAGIVFDGGSGVVESVSWMTTEVAKSHNFSLTIILLRDKDEKIKIIYKAA
jgi:hypothetical protein